MKWQSKSLGCFNTWAGFVIAHLKESWYLTVLSPGGERKHISMGTSSECSSAHSCFTSVSITLPFCLLCLLHQLSYSSIQCRVYKLLLVVPLIPGDSNQGKQHLYLPLCYNAAFIFSNPADRTWPPWQKKLLFLYVVSGQYVFLCKILSHILFLVTFRKMHLVFKHWIYVFEK